MSFFKKIIAILIILICLMIAEYHWPRAVLPSFFAGLFAMSVTYILHDT